MHRIRPSPIYPLIMICLGVLFNFIAVKSNGGKMPAGPYEKRLHFYYLTDIFPENHIPYLASHYVGYYFSIGDVLIIAGPLLAIIFILLIILKKTPHE